MIRLPRLGRILRVILIALLLVIPDQAAKYAAWRTLRTGGPIQVIPGILELHYVENHGAAFGMLRHMYWIFILFAAVVAVSCLLFAARLPRTGRTLPLRAASVFLAAGAVGNMIDRVVHRYVIDFIYVSAIRFPVFNVADIYVVVSTGVLLILLLFVYSDDEIRGYTGGGGRE